MRGFALRVSIRVQLIALFGLLLLAGLSLLVLDEISEYRTRIALDQIKNDSLSGLRRIKAVSDAYGLEIVDTAFKVRNHLMGWEQGLGAVENALVRIRQHWSELQNLPRPPEQQALFAQIMQARVDGDRAAIRLRDILRDRDMVALGRFADTEMYPAIDPVTTRLKFLSDLEMIDAERVVRADAERVRNVRAVRIAISAIALLIAALVGRGILRNIYRGVESLNGMAQRMRQRDFEVQPRFRPTGELGEVVDAFLAMRDDMLSYENELTELLAHTEDVRRTLEQRELFQRSLLSAAQTAIVAVDAEGRFTHVNPFALSLLGYEESDLLGRRARGPGGDEQDPSVAPRLLPDEQLRQVAAELTAVLDREVAPDWRALRVLAEIGHAPREWNLLRRDGSRVPVLMAISSIQDEQGELLGLLTVSTDLTVIKQLEDELRASEQRARDANHAKSAFLATMSHEIRTPLIGVTGMVEVLGHSALDDEQRRALGIIEHSAQSLLQIIGDILDFSKIEAGKLELAPVALDLRRLVAATTYNFLGAASSKGINLGFEIDPALAPAHRADPVRLRQILGNFLSNAVKFTEHGEVRVEVRRLDGDSHRERIEFAVRDTGIGVDADAQRRLFQPFTQAETSTTRRFGGTGLGLAICRRLATLMLGEVSMQSARGEGTTMRLRVQLPCAAVEEIVSDGAPDHDLPRAFVPRRLPSLEEAERERSLILLADDHPTNRAVIARQLALAGFACETVEDGEAGLARWRSGRYALILSDVHMPKLDGYRMTAAIRAEEARSGRARTPIVALTAAALKGDAERCLAAGMDDYLAKPVSIPVLVECLRRWLPHLAPPDADTADAGSQPGSPLDGSSPIDETVLAGLSAEDVAAERELMRDFLETTRGDVRAARQGFAQGDLLAVSREAHKIKGAAGLVGCSSLAHAAEAVETAARAAQASEVRALLPDLDTALERLQHWAGQRYRD